MRGAGPLITDSVKIDPVVCPGSCRGKVRRYDDCRRSFAQPCPRFALGNAPCPESHCCGNSLWDRDRLAVLAGVSKLGNGGNGDLQAWNTCGQFGSLACRWIHWKPSDPLLVHTRELILIRQNNSGTDNLFQ